MQEENPSQINFLLPLEVWLFFFFISSLNSKGALWSPEQLTVGDLGMLLTTCLYLYVSFLKISTHWVVASELLLQQSEGKTCSVVLCQQLIPEARHWFKAHFSVLLKFSLKQGISSNVGIVKVSDQKTHKWGIDTSICNGITITASNIFPRYYPSCNAVTMHASIPLSSFGFIWFVVFT